MPDSILKIGLKHYHLSTKEMESNINTLPFREMLLLLLIGGLLHLCFRIITTYVIPILKKKGSAIGLSWNRIQIALWAIYLFLCFSLLFKENMYLTLAISVLIIGLGWSFWINFFAGLTIKYTNQFKVDDTISTEFVEGKIQAINISFTELINSKGELLAIPNRLLKNAVLKHINQKNKLNTSTFIYSGNLSYNAVYNYAFNCPFVSGNQNIEVSKNKNNKYEIKAMLLDESFKEEAVAYFEKLT